MKTRNSNSQNEVNQEGGCCETTLEANETLDTVCCDQPTDNSPCCDTNQSKEVNSKKTGCC